MIGPSTSSGEKTVSSSITTRSSFLHGLEVNPPDVGISSIKVYDSEDSTTSGRLLLITASVVAGQNSIYVELPTPRVANRGIYVLLTNTPSGANTSYSVAYSLG